MFRSTDDVIRALRAFGRSTGPRSSSVITTGGTAPAFDDDPFGRGFIDDLEARTTILKRFAGLDARERAILSCWYVQDLSVPTICETFGLSRATAYRLRDRALEQMTDAAISPIPSLV